MTSADIPAPATSQARGGSLTLGLTTRAGRTIAGLVAHRGALRVLRPRYDDASGWTTWTILNPGGGYLPGDSYDLTIDLAEGARATLIGQSATKIYRCEAEEVTQTSLVRLDAAAVLDWRAEPIIAYAGARYRQRTLVTRAPEATLLLGEVITPGWSAAGDFFSWSRVQVLTEIRTPDGEIEFLDNLVIDPRRDDPADPALAAGFSHLGSLVAFDRRIGRPLLADMDDLLGAANTPGVHCGLGLTPGSGFVLRVLAHSSEDARAVLDMVADELMARWFGRRALSRHQW